MRKKKTNTLSALFLTVLMLLSFGALQVRAGETVSVVGHQFSPYQNPDQSGFQNELVRETFKAVGLSADIRMLPPFRMIRSFYSSEFLVCADAETLNDEMKNEELDIRKKVYWNVPVGLAFYKPNLTSVQISALEKVKIFSDIDPTLTILSYGGYNPYNDAGFQGTVDIRSNSSQQTIRMVKGGRDDLGFEVLGVTPYFVTKDNPQNMKNWGFINAWIYVPQSMGFNGKDPKGIYYEKKFNEGLSIIKKNGLYINIYERLYGRNNIPKSAVDDPDREIREEDLAKTVENADFDMAKFLRQIRDETGLIIKFVK